MDPVSQIATYANLAANATVVAVTIVTVIAVALTHYEGLVWINAQLAKVRHAKRRVVLYAVLSLIGPYC